MWDKNLPMRPKNKKFEFASSRQTQVVVYLCFFYLDPYQNHAIVTPQCMHYFFVEGER